MILRPLGLSGIKLPALGFGCMRLPLVPGRRDTKRRCAVDIKQTTRMLHHAYENGVTYFDTAWGYHMGWSEVVLRTALRDLPRERIFITTKLPVWNVRKPADFSRILGTQLRRLGTPYLDFYLLHALNAGSFERVRKLGVFDFLERAKREGRIRHTGFSFHDTAASFPPILDSYDWGLCQVQYNIVDTRNQAGQAGVRHAGRKGIGVVVMEPLRGGDLAARHSPQIRKLWGRRSAAGMCLRWLWNQPEVSMVLSGMTTMAQLDDNLRHARRARVGNLSPAETEVIEQVQRAYRRLKTIPCTGCGYCLPCPHGVAIPRNFGVYNDAGMFPDSPNPRMEYRSWMSPGIRAAACRECGKCEERCPQLIPIRARLKEVDAALRA